jgi:hypothetical protein
LPFEKKEQAGKDEKKGETGMWWKSVKGKQGNGEKKRNRTRKAKKKNQTARVATSRQEGIHSMKEESVSL